MSGVWTQLVPPLSEGLRDQYITVSSISVICRTIFLWERHLPSFFLISSLSASFPNRPPPHLALGSDQATHCYNNQPRIVAPVGLRGGKAIQP